jgi:hypothetical protein
MISGAHEILTVDRDAGRGAYFFLRRLIIFFIGYASRPGRPGGRLNLGVRLKIQDLRSACPSDYVEKRIALCSWDVRIGVENSNKAVVK